MRYAYTDSVIDRVIVTRRLALYAQHAAVAGRSLGERLRWSRWADAARSGAPVR